MRSGRLGWWLVWITLCGVTVGCGGAQSRLAEHLQRGQAYFAQGNFTKANIEFRNALQIAPKDVPARLMAARTAEKLGQPAAAVGLYQSVIETTPDNVEARAQLGRLLIFGGAPARGLEVIKPALDAHPEDAALLALRGVAKMQLKDVAGASEDVEHALRLAPNNEEAVALQAGLYQKKGDVPAAIALVSRAVQQLPGTTDLREVLATLYLAAGDTEKAEVPLSDLVRLRPTNVRYRVMLASFYAQTHRTDQAQRVLEDAVKVMPDNDDMKLALVDFMVRERTPADGERTLRALIDKEPDNYTLRLALGTLFERAGRRQDAISVCEDLVRRAGTGPQGLTARDRLATIALAQGRIEDAAKLVAAVLDKNPRDSDALLLHGQLALARHDAPAAISDFRAVLRDQPKAIGAYRLLAQAHLANHEVPLAEEALRNAVSAAPTNTGLKIELAQLVAQSQGLDASITLLEDAVRAAPGDALAREALTRAYLLKGDYAAAATAANDLKTLRPEAASGYYLAGLAAEGQRHPDEARKEFERALAVQPGVFDVLSALAQLDLDHNRGTDAIVLVKKESERNPKAAAPLVLLGELYMRQKDAPAAVTVLMHATTLAPKWWVPYRELGRARSAVNDVSGAIDAYQAAIKAAPGEPLLIAELAGVYQRQGRIDDAIAGYDAWVRRNPHVQTAENNLAMLLVTYRSDRTSLDRARDLTAGFATSNSGSLLDTNGWVHFKRAEYHEALPVLERAVELSPDSKEIRYHLGMAELQAGQRDRARSDLETAVSGAATFLGADEARTTLEALKKG